MQRIEISRASALALAGCVCALLGTSAMVAAAEKAEAINTYDNLVAVEDPQVDVAFINPNADFSVFERVAILEPAVAFRSNWQRDQNRSRTNNVSTRDMERIKEDVATLFERVFTERLEAAGYEVVDVANTDVLLLRPAIVDLDITAPDTMSPGRSRTFTSNAGSATLVLELFDSVTGEILGQAADRKTARSGAGTVTWSNSVTNSAEATRMMGRWADALIVFLDANYKQQAPGQDPSQ